MYPNTLKTGDTIGLVTLSAPEAGEFSTNVDKGIAALQELGFKVKLSKHALDSEKGYLANDPELLAEDLNGLFADKSISGIVCTGGGTNANRLLPFVDYDLIAQNPKAIVGMSNPTVLFNAITSRTGLVTFHGPALVWNWGGTMPIYTKEAFKRVLMDGGRPIALPKSGDWQYVKTGKAVGKLLGGNLWSLQSLLGTQYEPKWEDAIFFWEDIGKEPRRLDAMLTHFKLCGVFDKIKGMIVGELVNCSDEGNVITLSEMLKELTAGHTFPILTGVRFGHTDEKLTLPIGAQATIDSARDSFIIN